MFLRWTRPIMKTASPITPSTTGPPGQEGMSSLSMWPRHSTSSVAKGSASEAWRLQSTSWTRLPHHHLHRWRAVLRLLSRPPSEAGFYCQPYSRVQLSGSLCCCCCSCWCPVLSLIVKNCWVSHCFVSSFSSFIYLIIKFGLSLQIWFRLIIKID